jgi:RNA polymerase sigma-70 factor, ECF subfamily
MPTESEIHVREQITRRWLEVESSVQAYVRSAISSFHDAQDVTQQVALTVARRFEEYDEARPFLAWVLWLAKSRIIDFYRKQGRQRVTFSDEVLSQLAEAVIERQPERSARQEALEKCLEKLPEKSRRMVHLRYLEEKSIGEVAQAIGSTAGSVRVMLFRVRDVLAECIETHLKKEVLS